MSGQGQQRALANATLPDGRRGHVVLAGDRIAAIGAGEAPAGAVHIDLGGRLVLPALIDGHLHLDKTVLGLPWMPHAAESSLASRIATEKRLRAALPLPVAERASHLLAQALGHGTTALRTHVDVDDVTGVGGVEAILGVRERWAGVATIQIVAFPQSGIVRCPGVAERLDEALRLGADLVGGLDPLGIDGDVAGHLDVVFRLAERHGKGIDVHLHDAGEDGLAEILDIAARTAAAGLTGRVTVSHAFALGSVPEARAALAAERLAAAGVAVLTSAPGAAAMPPVRLLRQAGVRVVAGSDNVRDLWSPLGNASMLERCMLVAYRSGYRSDPDLASCLDLATTEAAALLGLADRGLAPGARADLIVVDAGSVPQAIAERPRPAAVITGGRLAAGALRGLDPMPVPAPAR